MAARPLSPGKDTGTGPQGVKYFEGLAKYKSFILMINPLEVQQGLLNVIALDQPVSDCRSQMITLSKIPFSLNEGSFIKWKLLN